MNPNSFKQTSSCSLSRKDSWIPSLRKKPRGTNISTKPHLSSILVRPKGPNKHQKLPKPRSFYTLHQSITPQAFNHTSQTSPKIGKLTTKGLQKGKVVNLSRESDVYFVKASKKAFEPEGTPLTTPTHHKRHPRCR